MKSHFCYLTPRSGFLSLKLPLFELNKLGELISQRPIMIFGWKFLGRYKKLFRIFWWSQIFATSLLGLISLSLSLISPSPFPLTMWNFRKCSPRSMKFGPYTQKIILNFSVKSDFCHLTPRVDFSLSFSHFLSLQSHSI